MPTRCEYLAKEKRLLGPGDPIIIGCELIENSGIFGNVEKWSPRFCDANGVAGPYGATVIWPETGNDTYTFSAGESVPAGTEIHQGQVYDNGEWHDAPYTVTGDGAIAGPETADIDALLDSLSKDGTGTGDGDEDEDGGEDGGGTGDGSGSGDGDATAQPTVGTPPEQLDELNPFCTPLTGLALPSDEEKDWLSEFADFQLPELKLFDLSGFTAFITKQLSKVNAILGKVQTEVDSVIDKVKLDPEKLCTQPVKDAIRFLLDTIKLIMKMVKVFQKMMKIIKIIQRGLKLAKKILKWATFPVPVVPIVEKLIDMLQIMSLVDMCVSTLIRSMAKFTMILPILQSQLMAILAACAAEQGQQPPTDKASCEAAGGTWIDPAEIKELQTLYDQMLSEATTLDNMAGGTGSGSGSGTGEDDGELFGFCSITELTNRNDCEAGGGSWTSVDADTDFSKLDTSALSNELAKQVDELNNCFSDPELQKYLNSI